MSTEFQTSSAAPVISLRLLTATVLFTRYAVPVSVLCTTALPVFGIVALVTLAVGATRSVTCPVALLVTVPVYESLPVATTFRYLLYSSAVKTYVLDVAPLMSA